MQGRLQTTIGAIGLAVALMIGLATPAAYLGIQYASSSHLLSFRAQSAATRLAEHIHVQGPAWVHALPRVEEAVSADEVPDGGTRLRVYRPSGEEIVTAGPPALAWPLRARAPIVVAGEIAGHVEAAEDLTGIARGAVAFVLLGLAMGGIAYLALHTFPLRMLRQTVADLHEAQEKLKLEVEERVYAYDELQKQHRVVEEATQALIEARDEALRADRTKSEFLSNMSHELRTPLNAIIGFSDIMANERFGTIGQPHYRGYAQDIHDSGNHLLELINEVLDLSKIEAGKFQIERKLIDLRPILSRCVRLCTSAPSTAPSRSSTTSPTTRCWSWPTSCGSSRSSSTCCPTR